MAEGKERAQARLENLEAIEPLLGSLRVLSLSNMQMALNRLESLDQYLERFNSIAAQLTSIVKPPSSEPERKQSMDDLLVKAKRVLTVFGSSRGIAGQYNRQLARETHAALENNKQRSVEVLAFGTRVQTTLTQAKIAFIPRGNLNTGSLPNYDQVSELIQGLMQAFDDGSIGSVEVISFRRESTGKDYKPRLTQLLPDIESREDLNGRETFLWPKPIIEGDPRVLQERLNDHLIAIKFYKLILEAVAAENLFRYRLLEEAKENSSNLLEELRQSIQIEHRKDVTQRLQEILVGSGMLTER